MKKLELLAPAGSLEICKAVIDAGADAVYLGGNLFGARAFAKNFDREQLFEALDYAHLFDKKIFLTVNTLLKNHELEKYLYDYIEPYYKRGLDAAIVQDFGVLTFLHKHFPDLPLHASTQMSVTNQYGAHWLKSQGVTRVVTAREVSLHEIRSLYEATHMEIESFVHGALCYCYSGQCLMSSLLGGRSGNRGRCAQPCRLAYDVVDEKNIRYNKNQQYPLSPKDLCTIECLPEMAEAGVFSYKIEGRMKQLEYAAGVTSIYRKYMDQYMADPKSYKVRKEDMDQLFALGNRNGFTKGYYYQRNDKSMLSLTTSAHKSSDASVPLSTHKSQIPVTMYACFITGNAASLTVETISGKVTVTGEVVMEAMKQPLQKEDVMERLKKTGDTSFSVEDVSVELSANAFLPVKFINELRRNALEALEKQHLAGYLRSLPKVEEGCYVAGLSKAITSQQTSDNIRKDITVSVLVRTMEQLQAVLDTPFVTCIYIDHALCKDWSSLKVFAEKVRKSNKKVVFAFPSVFRKNSADAMLENKELIQACNFDGLLLRTHDSVGFAKEVFPKHMLIADHGLYTYSNQALEGYLTNGFSKVTLPFELNEKELKERENKDSEMIVYGWIPVMYTAQCIYKNFESCHKKNSVTMPLFLKDRYAKLFPVQCDCLNCYNTIYNTQPLYLFGQKEKLQKMNFNSFRLEFLYETKKETLGILKEFREVFFEDKKADMTKWENKFTNGHFKRGIE